MQPSEPLKPLPPHYNPSQFAQGNRPRSYCGCFAIGCGGVVLLMVIACGIGYYGLFHSMWPLRFVESIIEDSGDVRVEGLSGTLASGIAAEQIQFRADGNDDQWSELNGLRVKYRFNGLFGRSSFVLEDLSLDGGRVFGRLDSSMGDDDLDLFGFLDPLQDAMKEIAAAGRGPDSGEFRVDQLRLADITFVDPATDTEFHIDEVSMKGLSIQDGEVVDLGEWLIRVDGLDVTTGPSPRPGSDQRAKRVSGEVKRGFGQRVLRDFSFLIDLAPGSDGQFDYAAEWFDSHVRVESWNSPGVFELTIEDFNPGDYFSFARHGVIPSEIRVKLTASTKGVQSIDPNGSFRLGETVFSDFQKLEGDPENRGRYFTAWAEVDGVRVHAKVRSVSTLPLLLVELQPIEGRSSDELWAKVAFDKDFVDLTDEEKQLIRQSVRRRTSSGATEHPEHPNDKATPPKAEAESGDESGIDQP